VTVVVTRVARFGSSEKGTAMPCWGALIQYEFPATTSAGSIDRLRNGTLRVRVYAGIDPVTKKRHNLVEFVAPGPKAAAQAEAARVRLVNQVNEKRHPRTAATVAQLLDRYLGQLRAARKTLHTYRGYVDKHVLPFLGSQKVGQVDVDILDSLYAELLRCREHCDATQGRVDHRTHRPHDCDDRCTPHECRPLAEWTVRKIHWILSGAFRRAQRWNWVTTNPMTMTEPPAGQVLHGRCRPRHRRGQQDPLTRCTK